MPRVIVTSRIEGAIAISSVLQEPVSKPQLPKDISPPVPSPVKPQPVFPKKLSEEEIQKLEDELKRLKINPEPCMNVIQKYWGNVQGAIARVKEALQQGWCSDYSLTAARRGLSLKKAR